MEFVSCQDCNGTGFVIRIKQEYCINNIYKLPNHTCFRCENRKEELNGKYKLCKFCKGQGYFENTLNLKLNENYIN